MHLEQGLKFMQKYTIEFNERETFSKYQVDTDMSNHNHYV